MLATIPNVDINVDILVVGAGVAGCCVTSALADGQRSVLMVDLRSVLSGPFSGELVHAPGAQTLASLALLDPLRHAGGMDIAGFVVYPHTARPEIVLPYHELRDLKMSGISLHHNTLGQTLRREAASRTGVELRTGTRVVKLIWERGRVVGAILEVGKALVPVRTGLVVGADGRLSPVRSLAGLKAEIQHVSYTAALLVPEAMLPHAGYGHIFLGAPGPILSYPISQGGVRICFDVPRREGKHSYHGAALADMLLGDYLTHLPADLAAATKWALRNAGVGSLQVRANHTVSVDRVAIPGLVLVGDAAGCLHPLTASGITKALNDALFLKETVTGGGGHRESYPWTTVQTLWQTTTRKRSCARKRSWQNLKLLTDTLYAAFRKSDTGNWLLRQAIFDYWERCPEGRTISLGLLTCQKSHPLAFLKAYLRVAGYGMRYALRERNWISLLLCLGQHLLGQLNRTFAIVLGFK